MDECSRCGTAIPETEVAHVHADKIYCAKCLAAVKEGRPESPPFDYHCRPVPVPDYAALRIIAGLLSVTGLLEIILAILFGVVNLGGGSEDQRISVSAAIVIIISGVLSGLVILGIGQLLECVRDATINSFHIRNQTLSAGR
ncbi:MAG TPA: hypothetical protein VM008_05060 [Phycisphaerae bacterium]|nr:hypothetical protein [Phycisphaerae bacterium]